MAIQRGVGPVLSGLLVLAAWWHFGARESNVVFVGNSASMAKTESLTSRGAVDKALKNRMTSVTKTAKLTDAMRLVAAAKIRRAQDGVAKARPFSDELQSMIKGLVKRLKNSGLEAELPMLRVPEKVANVALVVFTSSKGLCGGFNAFTLRKAVDRILELNEIGITPKIVMIGKKGKQSLPAKATARPGKKAIFNETLWFDCPNTPTAAESTEIAEAVKNLFLSGEVDKVEVVYAKFVNLLTNTPSVRTLLPLSPTGIENAEDETFVLTSEEGKFKAEKQKVKSPKAKDIEADVLFDQPPEVILNSMLPLYLNSQVLSIMFDSQASELSSRMTAMKAATDNAKELGKKLVLLYNKKRQAQITAEIAEISSAAVALEGSDDKLSGAPFSPMEPAGKVFDELMEELKD